MPNGLPARAVTVAASDGRSISSASCQEAGALHIKNNLADGDDDSPKDEDEDKSRFHVQRRALYSQCSSVAAAAS